MICLYAFGGRSGPGRDVQRWSMGSQLLRQLHGGSCSYEEDTLPTTDANTETDRGPTKSMNFCTAVNDALHSVLSTDSKYVFTCMIMVMIK